MAANIALIATTNFGTSTYCGNWKTRKEKGKHKNKKTATINNENMWYKKTTWIKNDNILIYVNDINIQNDN